MKDRAFHNLLLGYRADVTRMVSGAQHPCWMVGYPPLGQVIR